MKICREVKHIKLKIKELNKKIVGRFFFRPLVAKWPPICKWNDGVGNARWDKCTKR